MNFVKYFVIKFFSRIVNLFWEILPLGIKVLFLNKKVTGILDYSKRKLTLVVSSQVSFQRLNSCKKEPETVTWICSNLEPSGVFYDIGANTGSYSLVAATLLNNEGRVVSFEPVPSTFIELCQNIQINGMSNSITPINIPLSEENSISKFGLNSFMGGVGMHMGISKELMHSNSDQTIFHYLVKTQTLDSVVKEFELPLPSIMKIDVDGPEFQILKGASNVLKNNKLKSLQIEIDQVNQPISEIVLFLEAHGLILKEKHKHGESDILDFVFYRLKN